MPLNAVVATVSVARLMAMTLSARKRLIQYSVS